MMDKVRLLVFVTSAVVFLIFIYIALSPVSPTFLGQTERGRWNVDEEDINKIAHGLYDSYPWQRLLEHIRKHRTDVLEQVGAEWREPAQTPLQLNGTSPSFSDDLKLHQSVTTFELKMKLKEVLPFLQNKWYQPCTAITKRNTTSSNAAKNHAFQSQQLQANPLLQHLADKRKCNATFSEIPFEFRDNIELENDIVLSRLHMISDGIITHSGAIKTGDVSLHFCSTDGAIESAIPDKPRHFYSNVIDEVFLVYERGSEGVELNRDLIGSLAAIVPYVPFLHKHPKIKIYVGKSSILREAMTLFAFDPRRLIREPISSRLVYVPGRVPCQVSHLFTPLLLSRLMEHILEINPLIRPYKQDVLLLHTNQSENRFRKEESFVLPMLNEKKGFITTSIFPHSLNFVEYIRHFQRPRLIISFGKIASRSLLPYMVFSKKGTVIIELSCQHILAHDTNMILAFSLGHRYFRIHEAGSHDCDSKLKRKLQSIIPSFIH